MRKLYNCVTVLSFIGRGFAAALLPRLYGTNPRSHHKGASAAPPIGFELETNGFQFYAISYLQE